jgi:hypothetical protein
MKDDETADAARYRDMRRGVVICAKNYSGPRAQGVARGTRGKERVYSAGPPMFVSASLDRISPITQANQRPPAGSLAREVAPTCAQATRGVLRPATGLNSLGVCRDLRVEDRAMNAWNFSHPQADVYVPSGVDAAKALARVTHLCVAAHQDDIEILAYDGICDCLDEPKTKAFGGVVVTNGAGSPRTGVYSNFTDEQMQAARREEQRAAARLGGYAIQISSGIRART